MDGFTGLDTHISGNYFGNLQTTGKQQSSQMDTLARILVLSARHIMHWHTQFIHRTVKPVFILSRGREIVVP